MVIHVAGHGTGTSTECLCTMHSMQYHTRRTATTYYYRSY